MGKFGDTVTATVWKRLDNPMEQPHFRIVGDRVFDSETNTELQFIPETESDTANPQLVFQAEPYSWVLDVNGLYGVRIIYQKPMENLAEVPPRKLTEIVGGEGKPYFISTEYGKLNNGLTGLIARINFHNSYDTTILYALAKRDIVELDDFGEIFESGQREFEFENKTFTYLSPNRDTYDDSIMNDESLLYTDDDGNKLFLTIDTDSKVYIELDTAIHREAFKEKCTNIREGFERFLELVFTPDNNPIKGTETLI